MSQIVHALKIEGAIVFNIRLTAELHWLYQQISDVSFEMAGNFS